MDEQETTTRAAMKRLTRHFFISYNKGRENEDYYPEVATRLKMKPFASLTKVTDRDLQRIYQLALREAGESEE